MTLKFVFKSVLLSLEAFRIPEDFVGRSEMTVQLGGVMESTIS